MQNDQQPDPMGLSNEAQAPVSPLQVTPQDRQTAAPSGAHPSYPQGPNTAGPGRPSRPARVPRPARPPRRVLDGILLLDKPVGLSSHDALLRAKGMLRAKKAGHTGTLDPLASGLLPLCFGEATKFSQDLLDADKFYDATMRLGERTDTGDAEGEIVETRPVTCDLDAVDAAIGRFRGDIVQIPPMYSAIKRDGKPLYEYARAGQTIERESRPVTIHALERLSDATLLADAQSVQIRVHCSKGTYIRTLAEDIGEALKCGAHLTALRRTRVGALTLDAAVTLQALQAQLDADIAGDAQAAGEASNTAVVPALDPTDLLQPIDALLSSFPAVMLDDAYARRFMHGQRLRMTEAAAMQWPEGQRALDPSAADIGRVRVYGPDVPLARDVGASASQVPFASSMPTSQPIRLLGTATLLAGLLAPERLVGTAAA